MPRPWRLRHKLSLGLTLVVLSVGLLLGGSLLALSSYVEAGRITIRKLSLIQVVAIMREHIHNIAKPSKNTETRENEKLQILHELHYAREAIKTYRTMRGESAPGATHMDETFYLNRLETTMNELQMAVNAPGATLKSTGNNRLIEDAAVKKHYDPLVLESTELMLYIKGHIEAAIENANANHRRGLFLIGSATATAMILVLTLLYYFRVWVSQ
ncbi:MAG: hypothetical protein ACRCZF_17805, partial [Gemmataceae bacterium]